MDTEQDLHGIGDPTSGNFSFTSITKYCYEHPDAPECEDIDGYYQYDLSIDANSTFLAFFALSLLGYLIIFAVKRTGLGFTIAMSLGMICEILGYSGRILSAENRFNENGFLIQICCLTVGPAFMAAGIYLCLRRIVYTFGTGASRISPEAYTRIVSSCSSVGSVLPDTPPTRSIAKNAQTIDSMIVHSLRCHLSHSSSSWRRHSISCISAG